MVLFMAVYFCALDAERRLSSTAHPFFGDFEASWSFADVDPVEITGLSY